MPLESGVPLGRLALLASRGGPARSVPLGRWGRKASRERRGPLVQLGMTVNWGPSGCQELPDLLGPRERMETREKPEDQARRAAKETKEKQDHLDRLAFKVPLASLDHRVRTASQVLVDSRA